MLEIISKLETAVCIVCGVHMKPGDVCAAVIIRGRPVKTRCLCCLRCWQESVIKEDDDDGPAADV